ncbi:MAG: GAF domain-containing sensor histidine kinase [Hymenobacteraceae bacterium]|nr:GAF domain-containing sensor histidine kinase [Hymenobacteraceae bacterium]
MAPAVMAVSPPLLLPANEPARQRALDRYEILDTDAEFAFDDLTRLASLVCQTPISLIGLMDNHRQWLKAHVGLPAEQTQLPRELAFCNYVVATGAPLEIANLTTDDRFADSPFVVGDAAMRFYAGVPLLTADNYCLGTVCVIDSTPRELTNAQRQALTTIAEQVMAQLELKLRNRQLETGFDRLTRANRRLDQFTAMVSHDLKAPLASLLSLADLMLGDARQGDADAVCEALTVMSGEVGRMQSLVGCLLAFARSTRPMATVEAVDLRILLNELRLTLPGASRFTFSFGEWQPVLQTTPIPLRQVLYNLLFNAIHHHPAGEGHISVEIMPGPGASRVTFRVSDDGAGIAPADRERVFLLFQRLRPHGLGPEGSGVGLATVKHVVEDHGGSIHIEDGPAGQGATFVFTWEQAAE